MALPNLVCPNCHCPLSVPAAASQTVCPRCASWIDLEASCSGACLSCHVAKKAESTGSCAELASSVPVKIEQSASRRGDHPGKPELSSNKKGPNGLKALLMRVFHV